MEKNKKNFKIESRFWTPGDLVKVKASEWNGHLKTTMGVVVEEVSNKENLFPYAVVYDMSLEKFKKYYLYDLELISPAA